MLLSSTPRRGKSASLSMKVYRAFVAAYREAAEKLRAGDRAAIFPAGSFPPALPFVGGCRPAAAASARVPLFDLPSGLVGKEEVCLGDELSGSLADCQV